MMTSTRPRPWVHSDENGQHAPASIRRNPKGTGGKGPGQQHLADGLPYRKADAAGPGKRARIDPEPRRSNTASGDPGGGMELETAGGIRCFRAS